MSTLRTFLTTAGTDASRFVVAATAVLLSFPVFADLSSISTRAIVANGGEIMIAGFIITEADPQNPDGQQCVAIRGRGQSVNVPSSSVRLSDPYLTLKSGSTTLEENDDWQDFKYSVVLEEQGLAPSDPTDAAIYTCLDPGPYTALVSPGESAVGVGIVEVVKADYYDVSQILAVDLRSDRTTVLAGDHLDFAAAPQLDGATYNAGNRTLTINVNSGTTVATWPELFEPGKYYYVTIEPTGLDSNIEVRSGTSTLIILSSDQSRSFTRALPAQDLSFVSTGANAASLTISVRDAVELSWQVSNAETCTTTGEWIGYDITPGPDGAANSSDVFPILTNIQEPISFGLVCDNSTQPAIADSVSLESTTCPGAGIVDVMTWENLVFSAGVGFEWPNPTGNYATIRVTRNTTKAIEFNTSTADAGDIYGSISNPEFGGEDGERDISISLCPGQFEDLPTRCVKKGVVSSGSIYWEIDGLAGDLAHTCKLDKGVDGAKYYFNVRFPSGCGDSSCLTRVQP